MGSNQVPDLDPIQLFIPRQNLPTDNASLTLIHAFFASHLLGCENLKKIPFD